MMSGLQKKKVFDEAGEKRVSMNLTARDVENMNIITDTLNARQQVVAVSRSLEIARTLLDEVEKGCRIVLEKENGDKSEVKIIF